MSNELFPSTEPIEGRPRSSMTLKATLDDGTAINLTVFPSPKESSAVTASTTFTESSFYFHICTSLSKHSPALRKHPDSPRVPSPIKLPFDKTLQPTSTSLTSKKHLKPTLPEDVVAIDTGEKSYLFYVSTNEDGINQLSYLESPDDSGKGNYKLKKIANAIDDSIKDEDDNQKPIRVSNKTKQVAAVTWRSSAGPEIRVYYVEHGSEHLREVCKAGNGRWTIGSLSYNRDKGGPFQIRPGTSISASVHTYPGNKVSLRVFAAEEGKEFKGLPLIYVYKFLLDTNNNTDSWGGSSISNTLEGY